MSICTNCKKREAGKRFKTCLVCRKSVNKSLKRLRAHRKRVGLCLECGFPVINGRCLDFNDKATRKMMERYHRRVQAGLCVTCGKRKIADESICMCSGCLKRRREWRDARNR